MKKLLIAIALPAALAAQQQSTGYVYQSAVTSGEGQFKVMMARATSAKPVLGRPFSATETHHSLQVLADGTRIESTSTDKFFRDDQGRTRIERDDNTILINDPVSGASVEINGNHTSIRRSDVAYTITGADAGARLDKVKAELDAKVAIAVASGTNRVATIKQAVKAEARNEEKLGFQVVNGVSAEGTRSTTTIPISQIGNDRPINIVSERWYSPDLEMLIKSVNNDPRFGETTYEVTNIVQGQPDPSLFKIPSELHQ